MPESALVRWSARTFGHDVAARVFSPLVADWARDVEAAPSTPTRRSAWLQGTAAFAGCTLSVAVSAAVPRRGDLAPLVGGLAVAGGFLALGVGVLLTPYLPWWLNRGAAFLPVLRHIVLIALAFALPFSLLPAALLLGSRVTGPGAWRARAALTGAAVTVTASWRSGRGGPCRRCTAISGARWTARAPGSRPPTTRQCSA